jgi:hypothetical protein
LDASRRSIGIVNRAERGKAAPNQDDDGTFTDESEFIDTSPYRAVTTFSLVD